MLIYKKLAAIVTIAISVIIPKQLTVSTPEFVSYGLFKYSEKDIQCLAQNIYFEARGEPIEGRIAVAQVTINRLNHKTQFEKTICGVVYAPKQFSWTEQHNKIKDVKRWQESIWLAKQIISGKLKLIKFSALYFHNLTVIPKWTKKHIYLATIGNHIFYA